MFNGIGKSCAWLIFWLITLHATPIKADRSGIEIAGIIDPPTLEECPLDISTINDPGACGASVGWVPPVTNGTLTSTHNPGDNFPVGTTTVTYTATNMDGTTSCSFEVTVFDAEFPVLGSCPADIIIEDPDECQETVSWTPPSASDNCGVIMSSTHNPGALFPIGTTTVTYTASDAAGNSVSCSFEVTLIDDEEPELDSCPEDIDVNTDDICGQIVSWVPPVATDDCNVTLTSTHNPGDTFPVGITVVTYTATDDGGNQVQCSFEVKVEDTTDPVWTNCNPQISISDYQAGSQDAVATWIEPVASDNCGISTIEASHSPGERFPLGTTTVTYRGRDLEGNEAFCSFEVTVVEQNSTPQVNDVALTVNAGETVRVCLQAVDQDGDNLTLQIFNTGLAGIIGAIDASGLCFDYTAPENFEGTESISVTVCDDGTPKECNAPAITITVEIEWQLEISQLVTPNGDGINDTWFIGNIDKYPDNQVAIFDRWGSSIYQAQNYNNSSICWSGNLEGDHSGTGGAPSGTYYYQIEISDGRRFKGFIELVGK